MSEVRVVTALAKVLTAAAWADGKIDNEEMNCLKDLLFQLSDMTASDWAELELYMATPIGEAERARLLDKLAQSMRNDRDKVLVLNSIDALVQADGVLSKTEAAVVEEVKQVIDQANTSIIGQMGHLIRGAMGRRSQAVADVPNREQYLADFVRNRVFYLVRERMGRDDITFDSSEAELRKLSLAGGLMARVAHADRDIHESEVEAIAAALEANWSLKPEQAVLVAEIAASAAAQELDTYRLAREFYAVTSEPERVHFLDALFAVARSHDNVSHEEIENIRTIARLLKLAHDQFIQAKLKIPREERDGL